MTASPNMLAWALRYAASGLAIFPLHEPVFNHPEGYVCACEVYRHTELCRQRDAERQRQGRPTLFLAEGEHCDQPGKHPHGVKNWRTDSTTDEAVIRQWWGKWPEANIGIDCGKSGLLVLDADAYKDSFAGSSLLSEAGEETVTALTGGGGQHLYYRLPPGKAWGNATGTLPNGIDIRGVGGFVVAPGSLHASGRRYQFEVGYSPDEIEIADVPDWLADILDAAAKRCSYSTGTTHRWNGTPTTTPVDLARWNLPDSILDQIAHPAVRGQRSEIDMRICVALVAAGATDDEILAVFQHEPCGTQGKMAEAGLTYLGRTLSKAHRWIADHPKRMTPDEARRTIDAMRLQLRSLDFAALVPTELQARPCYRTGNVDRIVADASLSLLADYGALEGRISYLQLSERTGRSVNTCKAAMQRLCRLLEPVTSPGRGEAATYRLNLSCVDCKVSITTSVNTLQSTQLPLSTHGGHDVFVRSLTNVAADELAARNAERAAEDLPPMRMTNELRRRLAAAIPSAGSAVLLAIDALEMYGGMTRSELGVVLFKKKHAVSRLTQCGLTLGLLVEDGERIDVAPGWRELADALSPFMPTFGTANRRKLFACDSRQRYCDAALRNPALSEDERRTLTRRAERAAKAKLDIAIQEAPDLAQRKSTIWAVGTASAPVRQGASLGLHTPNRATAAQNLADAAYWHRLGDLTPAQRYFVELGAALGNHITA